MANDLELYFRYRCEKGLEERGLSNKPKYRERLEHEIETIRSLGFVGYFLIVSDFITWALDNNVPVGPGRGSAVSSLVAYCLKITHLDPIKYKLIFNRFLNPHRNSPPDIDCDFCETRRIEVLNYVREKYGEDKVAHIGTFGSMKAKAAIRDVGRTLGYEYNLGDKLARLVLDPIAGKPQPLSVCYEKVPELEQTRHGKDSAGKEVLRWAETMENRIKSFGTHASALVISRDQLNKTIPLYPGKDKAVTTQFEMNTVEECGLIKFDFLGLRALTTIDRCVKMVSERYGIDIDPLQIPVDDEETYQLFREGKVDGIFQLEGATGIRDLLIKVQPTCLEDLSVVVAVFRPGPLASPALQHYLKVRAGHAKPKYTIPELEPILKDTDGMMIYQEQVLHLCRELAGFSMAEADLARRAIGKKKQKEMDAIHPKFIKGMKKVSNISKENAQKVWDEISAHADYSFNASHSIAYSFIGYQMAYLKAHYPLEFMCACLISDSDETDKIIQYIAACKELGIKILGPDINQSEYNFSVTADGNTIRFGLGAVKNLGKPIQGIIKERNKKGNFKNLLDFASRVDLSKVNRMKLESLVLSGAFDNTGDSRNSLLKAVDSIIDNREEKKKYEAKLTTYQKKIEVYEARQHTLSMWEAMSKEERKDATKRGEKKPGKLKRPIKPELPQAAEIPKLEELSSQEVLSKEKELLGYFLTGHPLDDVEETTQFTLKEIKNRIESGEIKTKCKVKVIAIPSMIKEITTKKEKKKMAYMSLEDKTATIQAVIIPSKYAQFKEFINIQTPALYSAMIDITERDDGRTFKFVISDVKLLYSLQKLKNKPIDITIDLDKAESYIDFLLKNKGNNCKVNLRFKKDTHLWEISTKCSGDRAQTERLLKDLE